MDRSELQATRTCLDGDVLIGSEELREIARRLLDEVVRGRLREGLQRACYAELLEAARATVAAARHAYPDPTAPLVHQLRRLGLLPPTDMLPAQALADAVSLCRILQGAP